MSRSGNHGLASPAVASPLAAPAPGRSVVPAQSRPFFFKGGSTRPLGLENVTASPPLAPPRRQDTLASDSGEASGNELRSAVPPRGQRRCRRRSGSAPRATTGGPRRPDTGVLGPHVRCLPAGPEQTTQPSPATSSQTNPTGTTCRRPSERSVLRVARCRSRTKPNPALDKRTSLLTTEPESVAGSGYCIPTTGVVGLLAA